MAIPESRSLWAKNLNVAPGHWKKQLPGKLLKLAERGRLTEIRALIDTSPELLNKRGSHGRTFLWSAIRHDRAELVNWLLDQGADVNLTGSVNSECFVQLTPLAACTFYSRSTYIEVLKRYGATNDIFRATFLGRSAEVLAQIDEQPALLSAEDPEDEIYHSPLLAFAIVGGELLLAKEFIRRGFPVSKYSFQLLFLASHFGHGDFIDELVGEGADIKDADASLWMSTNDPAMLAKLVDCGLSANQRPNGDLTPLLYACRADKGTNSFKINMLLELGADVNAVTLDGRTALHNAVMSNNYDACQSLLRAGVSPTQRTNKGQTAADLAELKGNDGIVSLIARYTNS